MFFDSQFVAISENWNRPKSENFYVQQNFIESGEHSQRNHHVNQMNIHACTIGRQNQGPKLTFLCEHQVATEIFFSVARWKILVAKKCP